MYDEPEERDRLEANTATEATTNEAVARSIIVLDVKPLMVETNMTALEDLVRSITMDGLTWGDSELVPVAFGIRKLRISCVIEDVKVSVHELQERIEAFEEFVQSTDIVSFSKL